MSDISAFKPPIFVLAPRYARDLGIALNEHDIPAEILRDPVTAAAAAQRSDARVAIVDARGAMAAAMLAAHEVGAVMEARRGTMLVLVARGDSGGMAAAYAAGATQVLISPISPGDLATAINFALRVADRLATAAAGTVGAGDTVLHRDPLTGLATAHHAFGWLRGLLDGRNEPDAAVLLIGVGRFAAINAAHGQPAGDALLQAVAERLGRIVADTADGGGRLVARMVGAEFAVVLPPPVSLGDAVALARRIVAGFDTPFASQTSNVYLAGRVGVAIAGGDVDETAAERLFRQAGAALATARTGAPGSVTVFHAEPEGGDRLARLAELEAHLRRAIAEDEIEIVYQPQVAIADDRIAGVEALVRWRHPVFGLLPAETLLEVAAAAEFATELGSYIRGKALREASSWPPDLAGLQMSVNVTAADLRAADFTETLASSIETSGFPAERLTIEITESELIENLDAAAETLAGMRERGVGIALDDFGTGYSSLAYLKTLPLDALKLDRRLTRDLAGAARDRVVVRVVVALARSLGIRVVAEGVETDDELALVSAARCDWYQGFLCAPPMPERELIAFVEQRALVAAA